MGDLTVTAAKVGVINPARAETVNVKIGETITEGDALYLKDDGLYWKADADAGATQRQFRGVALEAGVAGEPISMLKEGSIFGWLLAVTGYADSVSDAMSDVDIPDSIVYLSNTAGALSVQTPTNVPVARIVTMNDGDLTRVLHIEADWLTQWGA